MVIHVLSHVQLTLFGTPVVWVNGCVQSVVVGNASLPVDITHQSHYNDHNDPYSNHHHSSHKSHRKHLFGLKVWDIEVQIRCPGTVTCQGGGPDFVRPVTRWQTGKRIATLFSVRQLCYTELVRLEL